MFLKAIRDRIDTKVRCGVFALACLAAGLALAIPTSAKVSGFTATQVSEMDTAVNTTMTDDGYPGMVVAIWGPNGESYVKAFGYATLGTDRRPLSLRDAFRVGSITKTFVGTLILKLVKQGLLQLGEPLSHFFKWIPNANRITIRMLLNHTSLIPDIANSTIYQLQADPSKRFSPDRVIRTAVAQKYFPEAPPLYHYSDVNYMILGRIAEKVTGSKSLKQLLARDVLAPLGLHHTYFDPTIRIRGLHARGYEVFNGQQTDVTNWGTSYTWAAGSMVSTLGDLRKWARDLVSGALLDRNLQRKRETFISTGTPGLNYGLGLMQIGSFCGHNGLIYGYDSTMLHSSAQHATIVILGNADPVLDTPALANPYPPGVPDTLQLADVLGSIAFPPGATGNSPC